MTEPSIEQIRIFRLRSHHLDAVYWKSETDRLVGACGMQNTPPGAWETALFNRVPDCTLSDMEHLLYEQKTLLQAWSYRGTPVVFPVSESSAFLSALIPDEPEPWIYTQGITLALDYLQMDSDSLLEMLKQVIPQLDDHVIVSKSALDQTLAGWMTPLIPVQKRELWNQPSMYGSPDIQTVGGAVVSFLLRPCAFHGLVVFGKRDGISPTFTSFKNWTGSPLPPDRDAKKKLVRKYLHCYGPATADMFASWLGYSGKQARRMWNTISEELEPVTVFGKKAFILSEDRERLFAPASFTGKHPGDLQRNLLLLGGHDPYLDQRDRAVLQPDKTLQKQIWKLVTNPGAVVYRGEVIGIWTTKKKAKGMDIKMTLWTDAAGKTPLQNLAEEYAAFRQQALMNLEIAQL
ncbi:winged helix DNA-binding domain-containing protein [Hungatella hathewayi]|uniref:winged helix DNA-binding domain-containing protein n=1 Tax=Hungatella hathewayi TaxID=154046 RepID=UPI00210DB3CE|nr:winged helix DNA-binding domain-containing protein [Hungatella hathewayi]MCQ5385895.1 winged helix DNA-binding domain-containing protein [Hungatella hathewayi]